jgi:hypothetical protein
LNSSPIPPYIKVPLQLLYAIGNTNQKGKKRHEVGRLDKVLLIKVTLPPFDKYILFHLAKQRSIFSIMLIPYRFALNEAPSGRPTYFIGREETLQPKMLAKPSTLLTLPWGTNSDLAKLILKPKTISKHKNKQHKFQR